MHVRITLWFDRHVFEYDIYSLLKAFWPGADITIRYTDETEKEEQQAEETVCELYYAPGEEPYTETVRFHLVPGSAEAAEALGLSGCGAIMAAVETDIRSDKIILKNQVKELIYRTLSEQTHRQLPWGDLTGIRPVKLMSGLLQEGKTDEEALAFMQKTWFVSRKKAQLALQTAKREEALLKDIRTEDGYSLYIGIPFCPSICLYCSFGSHPLAVWKKKTDTYLDVLETELKSVYDLMEGRRPDTIYIGGGTPTSLTEAQLERLLTTVTDTFVSDALREFTVEAGRPDTITKEKLQVLRQFPVDRISVNPQTMNQETLDRIGRKHTVEETRTAFAAARDAGFTNINMDLIVGLPGEGEKEVARTLEEIRKLSPDSLTVHSLALKRATRLHLFRDAYEEESFVNSERIMDMTEACAADLGMTPYYLYRQKNIAGNFENVGYAREGKACLYNILIMEQRQTILGAGSGASTKLIHENGTRVDRVENVKDLQQYLTRIEEMTERKRKGIEAFLNG